MNGSLNQNNQVNKNTHTSAGIICTPELESKDNMVKKSSSLNPNAKEFYPKKKKLNPLAPEFFPKKQS